jgi:2-oxoglutarate ferredoxin oxidoreductase subunit gamma
MVSGLATKKQINESILCAGFGGQGIMLLGKVLASTGMEEGLNVTWVPSYGAEVRGGTAYSTIRISSRPVSDPIVENASTGIIMNEPSLDKFEKMIQPGGFLIVNTSMTARSPKRKDLDVLELPLTDEALRLGNVRVANMIAAGVYAARKKVLKVDVLARTIKKMAEAAGTASRIPINVKAVERGAELACQT